MHKIITGWGLYPKVRAIKQKPRTLSEIKNLYYLILVLQEVMGAHMVIAQLIN